MLNQKLNNIRFGVALLGAKVVNWLIYAFRLGSGSTWPGEAALRIDPLFISHILANSSIKVILVAGTNGKTTSARLLVAGIKKAGRTALHNEEGANLLNGVASALIRGNMRAEYAVFELDENALPQVLLQIKAPLVVLLLNLFRDQLDRYGEVHAISNRWKEALTALSKKTTCCINADDPRLAFMGSSLSADVFYFGASVQDKQKKDIPHDVDSVYCPSCGNKLSYEVMSYSHLGDYRCTACSFVTPQKWTDPIAPLPQLSGVYNRYNVRAAVATLHIALHKSFLGARDLLEGTLPAFGRQERIEALGKNWICILSKNPSGFNQSIESLPELLGKNKTPICIILNDRIPDGTDVSWIWDVEFERVYRCASVVVATGDRTYDMAIRMQTALPPGEENSLIAKPDLKTALLTCTKLHQGKSPIIILATYTGMLEARKLLLGRTLL